MITIRLLRESEIGFVARMTKVEEWGQLPLDVKRCFECEREGFFMAEVGGEQAGHVFSISYGKLGWIGLMIVRAEYRRKGIDYLLCRGVETIKLDAVPEIADLYRKVGFVDEYYSMRYARIGKKTVPPFSQSVQPMTAEELEEIAEFDAPYFGANRHKLLELLFRDYPDYCFVSRRGEKIAGYVMARKTETGFWLGPCVCDPRRSEAAAQLISICMNSLVKDDVVLRVGTPSVNLNAIRLLQSLQFEEVSKSIRMSFGKKSNSADFLGVYGIGAPETG